MRRIAKAGGLLDANGFDNQRVALPSSRRVTGEARFGYKIEEYVCEDNRYFEDPAQRYQRLKVK